MAVVSFVLVMGFITVSVFFLVVVVGITVVGAVVAVTVVCERVVCKERASKYIVCGGHHELALAASGYGGVSIQCLLARKH